MFGNVSLDVVCKARQCAAVVCVLTAVAFGLAGCGDEAGSAGPYAGNKSGSLSPEQQKQDYAAALDRMMTSMEDQNAPPIERSIQLGDRKQLLATSIRWDHALATLEDANPPKDARAAHEQLVAAMRALSKWNQKIANAAPNKAETQRVAAQARSSSAARAYGEALAKLEKLGYLASPESDPLDSAGQPGG